MSPRRFPCPALIDSPPSTPPLSVTSGAQPETETETKPEPEPPSRDDEEEEEEEEREEDRSGARIRVQKSIREPIWFGLNV